MEVFDFNPESEPEHMILDNEPPNSESEQSSRGAGRGTRGRGRARARTAKKPYHKTIPEENESSSGYDFLKQRDSSNSSWSDVR